MITPRIIALTVKGCISSCDGYLEVIESIGIHLLHCFALFSSKPDQVKSLLRGCSALLDHKLRSFVVFENFQLELN